MVRTNSDGSQIKLKSLARVELGVEAYNAYTRLNGETCAAIAIYQQPGSNAVGMSELINSTMEELAKNFPEGIAYKVSLDTTTAITAGIKEIVISLIIALALVIFVVFLFIQNWRAMRSHHSHSGITDRRIYPLSGAGIFDNTAFLSWTRTCHRDRGRRCHCCGEAVMVNIAHGMNPKAATILAMKEVTAPIIATTLVMMAVFIPVAAMGGITGKLYQQFAITIAVSVVFSL